MKLVTFKENPHLGNMGHYGAVSYAFAIVQEISTSFPDYRGPAPRATKQEVWLYNERGERVLDFTLVTVEGELSYKTRSGLEEDWSRIRHRE